MVFSETSPFVIKALSSAVSALSGEDVPVIPDPFTPKDQARVVAGALGALQRYCNVQVSRRCWISPSSDKEQMVKMTMPCTHPRITQMLLSMLSQIPEIDGNAFDRSGHIPPALQEWIATVLESTRRMADQRINQFRLLEAADALGIPVFSILPQIDALGSGQHTRWFSSTITDKTSGLGIAIAKNKYQSAELLRKAGLPGAVNRIVGDVMSAIKAAHELGFPVVVKPNDSERGNGVSADLRSEAEVAHAFEQARKHSQDVLVEKHVQGYTHRLTVFEGEVVRVTKRIAGGVVGDGESTISVLIEQVAQSAPFLRRAAQMGRAPLSLDEEALTLLHREALSPESVPAPGQYVRLRRRDNINAGGTNEDYALAQVHPDNIKLAQDIALLFQLDFAGIDLLIQDISHSWRKTAALVCEVNAQPQLRASTTPGLYQNILKKIFAAGSQITADATVVPDNWARLPSTAEELSCRQPETHVACQAGLWLDGQCISTAFQSGYEAAVSALTRRDAKTVHAILGLSDVIHNGLPGLHWRHLHFEGLDDLPGQLQAEQLKRLVGVQFGNSASHEHNS